MAAAFPFTASTLLGVALGLGGPVPSWAEDAKRSATPAPATPPAPAPHEPAPATAPAKVVIEVRISGLGPGGCDVEVAPGSPDCQFRAVSQHVTTADYQYGKRILLEDVRATGTDRYCIFAITIREPGQPVKTVRRGLRLVGTSGRPQTAQVLNCYLSSPSRLAKASEMRERR
jgi:hypothetical protein